MRRCPKAWAGGFDHISVYSSSALPGSGHNNSGTGTQCSGRNASSSSLPSSSPSARRNNISSSVTPIVVMDEASRCLARRQPIAQRSLPTSGTTTPWKRHMHTRLIAHDQCGPRRPTGRTTGSGSELFGGSKSLLRNPTEASATPHLFHKVVIEIRSYSPKQHWPLAADSVSDVSAIQRCAPSTDGVLDTVLPADVRETIMIDNEALATNLTALHLHTSQVFLTPRDLLCHGCSIQHLRRSWWSLVVLCSVSDLFYASLWAFGPLDFDAYLFDSEGCGTDLLLLRQLSSRCYTIMCFVNNNFASNIVFKWVKLRV
jgi:hypothetical protein